MKTMINSIRIAGHAYPKGGAMTNIRKLLGGVSFLAVLLLSQPLTWGQSFGDNLQYSFTNCGKPFTVKVPGTSANDYFPTVSNKQFSCTLTPVTQSATTSGQAKLGFGLSVATLWSVAGFASSGGSSAQASDTVFLAAPAGFKGTSVTITIMDKYQLVLQGVTPTAPGGASVCWVLNGSSPICQTTLTAENVIHTFSTTVAVQKTNIGFQLPIKIFVVASGDTGQNRTPVKAYAAIVTPVLALPPGWKFTWASGE